MISFSIFLLFSDLFFHFSKIIWSLKIFDNFPNCKIWIFQIVKFQKFINFENWTISKNRLFPKSVNYRNFWILQMGNLTNFQNIPTCKINKNQNFSISKTIKIPKLHKFWNFSSIQYSTPLTILPLLIFALWHKSISTFQHLFPISVTLVSSEILNLNIP